MHTSTYNKAYLFWHIKVCWCVGYYFHGRIVPFVLVVSVARWTSTRDLLYCTVWQDEWAIEYFPGITRLRRLSAQRVGKCHVDVSEAVQSLFFATVGENTRHSPPPPPSGMSKEIH